MQKAIKIENSDSAVVRILSISDISILDTSLGSDYFAIEDYADKPEVSDPALEIYYPMYNKTTKSFSWTLVNYQITSPDGLVDSESLKTDNATLKAANESLQKTVDTLNNQINPVPTTFTEKQTVKQEENKKALATFLDNNPILFTDNGYYGVTEDDQNEMSLNLAQYQLCINAGQTSTLEWHPKHKACKTFTVEDFTKLVLAIKAFVYPYVQQCQTTKTQIYATTTEDELNAITINYVLKATV